MSLALVGLGANLGERHQTLDRAIAAIGETGQVRLSARSAWQETAPVGGPEGQDAFLNGAAVIETSLAPLALLKALQSIETQLGRVRGVRWDARRIDLDLLLYDEQILETPELTLPHPRMSFRRFVLAPAAEIAPHLRHPGIGWTVGELLEHLNTAPHYLAITGTPGAGKTDLAKRVAESTGALFCADPELDTVDGPGGAGDAAQAVELGLIRARAFALADALARSPQGVVSDFWLEQARAYVSTRSDGPTSFASELAATMTEAPEPKLVVLLERSASPLADALRSWATRPGRGPFLRLNAADRERALEEVIAAMLAMR